MHATQESVYVINNCDHVINFSCPSHNIVDNYKPLDLVKLETASIEYLTTNHQMGLRQKMHYTCLEFVGLISSFVCG